MYNYNKLKKLVPNPRAVENAQSKPEEKDSHNQAKNDDGGKPKFIDSKSIKCSSNLLWNDKKDSQARFTP